MLLDELLAARLNSEDAVPSYGTLVKTVHMTDTTARVITAISAGAAALSMLVAYLTYRRLRPRIIIRLEQIYVLEGDLRMNGKLVVKMRLVNRSASSARIEGFRLRLQLDTGGATHARGVRGRDWSGGLYEPEDSLIVQPMDGVKCEAVFNMRNFFSFPVDSGKIQATLGDGRTIQSKLDNGHVSSLRAAYLKNTDRRNS